MFDEQWLKDYYKRQGKPLPPELGGEKQSKYHNRKTALDGRTYDSKHEADRAAELKLMAKAMDVVGVAEQIPIHLPGGIKYVADFIVLNRDGTYTVEDAKGVKTDVYRLKKRLLKDTYGIDISEV